MLRSLFIGCRFSKKKEDIHMGDIMYSSRLRLTAACGIEVQTVTYLATFNYAYEMNRTVPFSHLSQ